MLATDITLFGLFGCLLMASYIGGGVVAWLISKEIRRDRSELRQERKSLVEENRSCHAEALELKKEIIDLRGQLAATTLELNKFTAVLDGREASSHH